MSGFRKDWETVPEDGRILYVMRRLVENYRFPKNGAAGVVGNLVAESGVLPPRIEGSRAATPLRARNFQGAMTDFTPQEVMDRNLARKTGPRLPGVGLAQWTAAPRRKGLFAFVYKGEKRGADILYDMDAQTDFLVTELQSGYASVHRLLTKAEVSVNDASDEVVYRFEVPAAVIGPDGKKLPRTSPAVVAVFEKRRTLSRRALRIYEKSLE
jgi:hypothetical protein